MHALQRHRCRPGVRLGADPIEHERFATAKVERDGHELDIATALTETYSEPGLPDVAAAASYRGRPGRRIFTINAIALPLTGQARASTRTGAAPTSMPACCASCTQAPSSTTRPWRCAPPATRPASASPWSRSRGAAARHEPGDRVGRSPPHRTAPPRRRARSGARLRAARRVGVGRAPRERNGAGENGW